MVFPGISLYDGCMSIVLTDGQVVSQSGVVYSTCLEYQGKAPAYVEETFGQPGQVICCQGKACGNGAVYLETWEPHIRVYDVFEGRGVLGAKDEGRKEKVSKKAVTLPPPCRNNINSGSLRIIGNTLWITFIFLLIVRYSF